MLSRFVIALPPRNKRLLISWLQSPSIVILEPKKIKSVTVSICPPPICHEVNTKTWGSIILEVRVGGKRKEGKCLFSGLWYPKSLLPTGLAWKPSAVRRANPPSYLGVQPTLSKWSSLLAHPQGWGAQSPRRKLVLLLERPDQENVLPSGKLESASHPPLVHIPLTPLGSQNTLTFYLICLFTYSIKNF